MASPRFQERFKGKTSVIGRDGHIAVISGGGIPINKTCLGDSPLLTGHEGSQGQSIRRDSKFANSNSDRYMGSGLDSSVSSPGGKVLKVHTYENVYHSVNTSPLSRPMRYGHQMGTQSPSSLSESLELGSASRKLFQTIASHGGHNYTMDADFGSQRVRPTQLLNLPSKSDNIRHSTNFPGAESRFIEGITKSVDLKIDATASPTKPQGRQIMYKNCGISTPLMGENQDQSSGNQSLRAFRQNSSKFLLEEGSGGKPDLRPYYKSLTKKSSGIDLAPSERGFPHLSRRHIKAAENGKSSPVVRRTSSNTGNHLYSSQSTSSLHGGPIFSSSSPVKSYRPNRLTEVSNVESSPKITSKGNCMNSSPKLKNQQTFSRSYSTENVITKRSLGNSKLVSNGRGIITGRSEYDLGVPSSASTSTSSMAGAGLIARPMMGKLVTNRGGKVAATVSKDQMEQFRIIHDVRRQNMQDVLL